MKEELLKLFKEIENINSKYEIGLTGSLMCSVRGIKTAREPKDLDILVPMDMIDEIVMPDGFVIIDTDTTSGYIDAVTYYNDSTGIKVDVLANVEEENFEIIENVNCGFLNYMIEAKLLYIKNDSSIESKQKHYQDLIALKDHLTKYDLERIDSYKTLILTPKE